MRHFKKLLIFKTVYTRERERERERLIEQRECVFVGQSE